MTTGRTIKQPVLGEPLKLWSGGEGSFPKPGELVEIKGGNHLTQTDRRIWNLMMVNAWPRIAEPVEHVIKKSILKGDRNGNERLADTVERLMTTLVEITVQRDGKPARRKVQLLGPTDEHRDDSGNLYYRFLPELISIIKQSDHWARLHAQVMLAMSSKYSLSLYEMIQKRAGYIHKTQDRFTLEEFREYLGVPEGKLMRYPDLRRYCIEPAVTEVSALSDFHVRIEPVKQARAVVGVEVFWSPKDEQGLKETYAELQRHKVGRKARIRGNVELVQPSLNLDGPKAHI